MLYVMNIHSTRSEKKLATQGAVNSVASWGLFVYLAHIGELRDFIYNFFSPLVPKYRWAE